MTPINTDLQQQEISNSKPKSRSKFKFLLSFALLEVVGALIIFSYFNNIKAKQLENASILGAGDSTYYVSLQGNDNPNCGLSTGTAACKSINYVLANLTQESTGGKILVEPGVYTLEDMVKIDKHYQKTLTIKGTVPYKAHLVGKKRVLDFKHTSNIVVEGLEMSHHPQIGCTSVTSPMFDTKRYVIQISDADGYDGPTSWHYSSGLNYIPDSSDYTRDIVIRNNVIHDSYCDDLIKVNKVGNIKIVGNVFYNQGGPVNDEHIDANSVFNVDIDNNIFFNDFTGSNRSVISTGPFIVIKDSSNGVPVENYEGLNRENGSIFFEHPGTISQNVNNTNPRSACDPAEANCDSISGNSNIRVRKNIFLNWQSQNSNTPFVEIGNEDSEFYVARNTLLENNLFLGNSAYLTRAAFGVKATYNTIFRHNTIVGDLPSKSHALRARVNNESGYTVYPNKKLYMYNNIWADYSGTMGKQNPADLSPDFTDVPNGTVQDSKLFNNVYWNSSSSIPNTAQQLDFNSDTSPITQDPKMARTAYNNVQLYRWNGTKFGGIFNTINEVFTKLATEYATLAGSSPAINSARNLQNISVPTITEDILSNPRTTLRDIGAFERVVSNQTIVLNSIEDTYIHSDQPTQNFGTANTMVVSGAPERTAFIKFNMTNIDPSYRIVSAKLKYQLNSGTYAGSVDTHNIQVVSAATWNGSTLTYANRPTLTNTYVANFGLTTPSQVIEVDLGNSIESYIGKYVSFAITASGNDNLTILSSEGTVSPVLTLVLSQ